jgi:hypothetical protein
MTKPMSTGAKGLQPHYKVRIALPGVVLHWPAPGHARRPKIRGTTTN